MRAPTVSDLDLRALLSLYGGAHGAWAPLMIGATVLGGGWAVFLLLPLLWHRPTRAFAAALAAGIVAQAVVVWGLKALTGRVRPWIALGLPPPLGAPHDFSFPSGHAAGSFCVAAFLVVALPAAWPKARRRAHVVSSLGVVVATVVAASRVYLGAHFPTDVVAGAVLGAVAGAFAGSAYARRRLSSRAS